MQKLKVILIAFFVIIIAANTLVRSIPSMHDNVLLAYNPHTMEYYAPPYLTDTQLKSGEFYFARYGKMHGKGYTPNSEHRNAGYFVGPDIGIIMKILGFGNEPEWGKDGNWGYPELATY
ncbi:hypothetical protein [Cloacibacillus porcorum]|uniref:hypothetical protein n=1 Tax=Cloacibacillus porcorum TaxID=1197717 RepID=UPI0026710642|nr:hypothetical protein [Cloacibacillus porcorum]